MSEEQTLSLHKELNKYKYKEKSLQKTDLNSKNLCRSGKCVDYNIAILHIGIVPSNRTIKTR